MQVLMDYLNTWTRRSNSQVRRIGPSHVTLLLRRCHYPMNYDYQTTDPKYRPQPLERNGRVRDVAKDHPYFEVHNFYSERRRLDDKNRFDELNEAEKLHEDVREQRQTWNRFAKREHTIGWTVCSVPTTKILTSLETCFGCWKQVQQRSKAWEAVRTWFSFFQQTLDAFVCLRTPLFL